MKQLGVIFALLCAVAWAFWGVFGKLSTNHGMPGNVSLPPQLLPAFCMH
jgi:hypothetical protein